MLALFPLIAATLFAAGIVKGALGLGLPLVGIAVLSLVMSPTEAAVLLLVPIFVTNLWQVTSGPNPLPLMRRLLPLLAATLAATFFASGLLPIPADPDTPRLVLGFAIATYGLLALSGWRPVLAPRHERLAGTAAGIVGGLIAGTTGVLLVPVVAFLQAIGLQKDAFVQALSMVFLAAGIALASGLAFQDQISAQQLLVSAGALLPAFLGMMVGARIRAGLDVERFRSVFCLSLVVLGLYQITGALL